MCGIVGVVGTAARAISPSVVPLMNSAIVHRGPDDEGVWHGSLGGVGMRRLSIIDLAGGHQPIWTDDGQTGIVFNGEIYNFRELRERLQDDGVAFNTHSDTEVILHCYIRYGAHFVDHLLGMFAICILDLRAGQVILVRDRLGKKPLYYHHDAGRLYFASEIKSIIAALDTKPALNLEPIDHFLTLRYVPAPETVWERIYKLQPGSRLTYDVAADNFSLDTWWRLNFASRPLERGRDYIREFETLFLDAVEKRLVAADVPVGTLLSGGLDSAVVCAAAVELGHKHFHTFSVGFTDGGDYSELGYARQLAEHVGSNHHEIVVDADKFMAFIDEFVWHSDEPLADLASVPLYYVSELARRDVKVVMSGEGSDEIFGGYGAAGVLEIYDRRKASWGLAPRWVYGLAARFARTDESRRKWRVFADHGWRGFFRAWNYSFTNVWSTSAKQALWRHSPADDGYERWVQNEVAQCRSPNPVDQAMQTMTASWLVEDLLMKADKMSMAASVELRCPFLDHKLVEWAQELPIEWKLGSKAQGYTTKRIVRAFAERRVPRAIIDRPKLGFPVPAYVWLQDRLRGYAGEQLLGEDSRVLALFNPEPMRREIAAAENGDRAAAHRVWLLIVLERWLRRWQSDGQHAQVRPICEDKSSARSAGRPLDVLAARSFPGSSHSIPSAC